MKTALLMISFAFSFSALARPELDRANFDRGVKSQNREVAKTHCPKENRPAFKVTVVNYEFSERVR